MIFLTVYLTFQLPAEVVVVDQVLQILWLINSGVESTLWTCALPFKGELLFIQPPLPGFYASPLLEASRPSHHLLLPLP